MTWALLTETCIFCPPFVWLYRKITQALRAL